MVKKAVLSKPQYEIIHEKNREIRMRDGTILRANITRPAVEGKYPVLLERTPYNKEGGSENSVGSPEFFARRGYVVVIQDVRGRYASEGEFYPFRDDGAGILLRVISKDGAQDVRRGVNDMLPSHQLACRISNSTVDNLVTLP